MPSRWQTIPVSKKWSFGGIPVARLEVAVVDRRRAAAAQQVEQLRWRGGEAAHLLERQGEQLEHAGPAGQGLSHRLQEGEVRGAREHEAPDAAHLVHQRLQVREQFRNAMHLVEYSAVPSFGQEPARVAASELLDVRGFE